MNKIDAVRRTKYVLEALLVCAFFALIIRLSAQEKRTIAHEDLPPRSPLQSAAILPNSKANLLGDDARRSAGR